MKKIILKLIIVAICCTVIILLIANLPDFGRGTGVKPIKTSLEETDKEWSNYPILGKAYVASKKAIKEKFSFLAKDEAEPIVVSTTENIQLIPVTFDRFEDSITLVAIDSSKNEIRVRLEGLIAPGSIVTPDGSQLDLKALRYSESIISSSDTIYLEIADEKYDEFGRTLAYVWLIDNTYDIKSCLNAILSDEGYAYISEKDFKYSKTFKEMSENAKESKRGLFYYDEF